MARAGYEIPTDNEKTYVQGRVSGRRCRALKSLDLSNWNTGKVTNVDLMFDGCSSLTDLNLSGMDTSEVTSLYQMFCRCSSLRNLNISGWDISNVKSFVHTFTSCPSDLHITCSQTTKDILLAKATLPSDVQWTIVP